MILPSDRYQFSSWRPRRKRGGGLRALLVIIIIVVICAGAFAALRGKLPLRSGRPNYEKDMGALWQAKSYAEINSQAKTILAASPLDENALVYDGFAYFYEGVAQSTLEKRLPLINDSIIELRRALLRNVGPLKASIYYVLGKAYYLKGKFYLDLAIAYLNKSIEDGYSGEDTYEYLGLAYSDLGDYDLAASSFKKGFAQHPSSLVLLILGQTYYKANNDKSAEEYLLRSINMAQERKNASVEEQARFLLGKIYSDRKEYIKAEDQYKLILKSNPKSADAHYYLGDIYSLLNENVKARAEWRDALRIDPSHWGARLKLYK